MSDEKTIIDVDEELYRQFFEIVGEGKRLSQSKAARELVVSPSLISVYKSRTYSGNITSLEDKIRTFLKREKRRISNVAIPVVETTTIDNIYRAIEMAHDYKDITVITGDTGTGKTTAVRQYEKESHAAFALYAYRGMTQQQLIIDLAKAVGVYQKGTKSVLIERIVEELKGRDVVLIIDQADYLSDASLELLRCIIVDMAEVGLVLVGMPRLKTKLETLVNDHEQLLSRVGTFLKVERMKAVDAAQIIQGVWESVSKEIIDDFVKAAKGNMRTLVKLIECVHRIMAVNLLETPTPEAVSDACEVVR